jgi:hypothetical protein
MKNVRSIVASSVNVEFDNYVRNTTSLTDYVPVKQEIYKQISPIVFSEVWNKLKKNK